MHRRRRRGGRRRDRQDAELARLPGLGGPARLLTSQTARRSMTSPPLPAASGLHTARAPFRPVGGARPGGPAMFIRAFAGPPPDSDRHQEEALATLIAVTVTLVIGFATGFFAGSRDGS